MLLLVWVPEIPPAEMSRHAERAQFLFLNGCMQIMVIGSVHFAARRLFLALQHQPSAEGVQSP
jgi:hypothetical protein